MSNLELIYSKYNVRGCCLGRLTDYAYFFNIACGSCDVDFPFPNDCAIVVYCLRGGAKIMIDTRETSIHGGDIIVSLPNQLIRCISSSSDFNAVIGIFTRSIVDEIHVPDYVPSVMRIMRINRKKSLNEEERHAVDNYIDIIQRICTSDHPNKLQIVRGLTIIMIYLLVRDLHTEHVIDMKNRSQVIVKSFLNLLQANYRTERSVLFYADKLNISTKHLTQTLKRITHRTTNEWIDAYVILEAKAMLKNTDKTIQQIAIELHFPNQSFFGKYFKRLEGISPKTYREKRREISF